MNLQPLLLNQSLSPLPTDILRLGVSRVTESLFFGGALTCKGYRSLNALGVTVFVNLQAERQESFKSVFVDGYLWVPVADHMPPTATQLGLIVDFMSSAIQSRRKVFVYCRAGVGRSALACAAYLTAQGVVPEEAISLLHQIRPIVQLSDSQMARLAEFASARDGSRSADQTSMLEEKH